VGGLTSKTPVQDSPLSLGFRTFYAARWRTSIAGIWDGSEPTSAVTGQRPAFATAASASPETASSQGSSNARGQGDQCINPGAATKGMMD
jgi:hypothetical protein